MAPRALRSRIRVTIHRGATAVVLALGLLLAGCYPDLDWRPLTPPDARFTILMPARAQMESRPIGAGTTMHLWTTRAGDAVFGAGYADYPDDARRHINEMRDAFLAKPGSKVVEDREFLFRDLPGRALAVDSNPEVKSDNKNGTRSMQVRLLASGGRLYQLAVISRGGAISKEDVELYFDSFRITP